MQEKIYIDALVGRVYKLLPLKEQELADENIYFKEYINSLAIDISGSFITFSSFNSDIDYITMSNIIYYLKENNVNHKIFKREVFKALKLLNKVQKRFGD